MGREVGRLEGGLGDVHYQGIFELFVGAFKLYFQHLSLSVVGAFAVSLACHDAGGLMMLAGAAWEAEEEEKHQLGSGYRR